MSFSTYPLVEPCIKYFRDLDLQEGDEVAVVGFTCEAVVLPVTELKLTPLYIDVETESFSSTLPTLEKLSSKTKAVVLQHTFGITPKHQG